MRRWMLGASVAVAVALVGIPVATADVDDTAEPLNGPPGTKVVIHWTHDECPGQLVAYLAELQDRPRLEAGRVPFRAPDDVFVIPAVRDGDYQILFSCPNNELGGFRFGVTGSAPTPMFTG